MAVWVVLSTLLAFGLIYLFFMLLIRVLVRLFAGHGPISAKVALRSVVTARSRSVLVLVGLSLGAFCVGVVLIFANTMRDTFAAIVQ